jgi:tetratricopeptide (TPR) repeat protein
VRSRFFVVIAAALTTVVGCAPRVVSVPTVSNPLHPDFIRPTVPAQFAESSAAWHQDRAWRFLQAGDLRIADREVAMALDLSPDFYPAETTSGWIALARSDAREGLTHFDRALALRADYSSALVGKGRSLVALDRDGEALQVFEAALAADPALTDIARQVEVLRFRGLEQDLATARQSARNGRLDESRQAYQAAIAASPDSAVLYRELAAVERQAGDTALALEHFKRALELEPSDAQSHAEIGSLLEAAGDLEGALTAYDAALGIEADSRIEGRRDEVVARIELSRLPAEYQAINAAPEATRADLAALVAVRLGPVLQTAASREAVVVTDVRGHWAEAWIMTATRAGVMDPFENHTFQPVTPVRRSDLAQIVTRLLPRVASKTQLQDWQGARTTFADLPNTHLAYPAASTAVASSVMAPVAGTDFAPSRIVSGAEAAAAIDRLRAMAGFQR